MLLGRTIFGIGGECMYVVQSAITSAWFKGNELALAFGANSSCLNIGETLGGFIAPSWADAHGLSGALFFGFGVCVIALFSAIFLVFVDWYVEKKDRQNGVTLSEEDT